MKNRHAFEFMDLESLPDSLRNTLRDLLKFLNSRPFRSYYDWIAEQIMERIRDKKLSRVVELGAGSAPITEALAKRDLSSVVLTPTDYFPDTSRFQYLERKYSMVEPIFECVDFTKEQKWEEGTLLVLSATLHHIPSEKRDQVIRSLLSSSNQVVIFEPLRRNMISMLGCLLAIIPGLLLPLLQLHRPNRFRRFFWCWFIPLAPALFFWDGIVSCLRQWTSQEWKQVLNKLNPSDYEIQEGVLVQKVSLLS